MVKKETTDLVLLVSAGAEWRALLPHFPGAAPERTPFGDCFPGRIGPSRIVFLHGGWGKVAAAASAQYAIDRWAPAGLVNLGTCGGFRGRISRGAVIMAEKTVIYDIIEQMTDPAVAIGHYSVHLDLTWLPESRPQPVITGTLVSADRDILGEDIPGLIAAYGASAADWESGAIAWVAARNQRPCLILRGVTDLVDQSGGEAYGNYAYFEAETRKVMAALLEHLPVWLAHFCKARPARLETRE